ncbi:hypothetical protein CUN67_29980 (plasmid) [Pantoea cypripedii]|uniref:Uncharacterized protein n=1 Tax=Pantoea cypripedii TaxID=55209 RepID=A0A6B9GHH4_PANCY|nr:hypothetical protein CUN67_29980 [Pantoea cypripedii]
MGHVYAPIYSSVIFHYAVESCADFRKRLLDMNATLPIYAVWLRTAIMPQRLRCAIDALKAAFERQSL